MDSLDEGATVRMNQQVPGNISGVQRQLDALLRGEVAGQPISIAIEAKRYQRRVSIGTIDEFIGKILDVGCDRGVLYSAGGFTDGALSRASNARNPAVGCVHLPPDTADVDALNAVVCDYSYTVDESGLHTGGYRLWLEGHDLWLYRDEHYWEE